ncbi:MAG: hypothetical protein D6768_05040 [Chloroflexi bacterium]|nr:MAG: hypothetical protein D6768_05040 [Chloroflexota bacterium]
MRRLTRSISIFSLLFLLSLTLAGVASADVISGKGWLHAEGSGVAKLQMNGAVEINGHGVGVVVIKGAEAIQASGHGHRTNLPDGRVVFRGYEGTIHAIGRHMTVHMAGTKIDFTARGKGRAVLRGHGTYETGSGSGDWQPDGLEINVEE